ncbi:carboxymuconolactone decarboxylase family protein [Natronorubrum daqingense]|uniref:Carboxymuconolactone decarboxylase n=1 Tax=Natronorubrum daqingense TaxID=588898 RepID=A0A1N7F3H9_9EURY|nr:carboxymuconolactone decarboxylase family protein [Natronorubrum daqingense]APX97511.1 carboxymuconolactone decarboxylase [Natronorubrum daqingense]SIR94913.1 Carboxymuconolactone decarboxylase family protein [Natronorubrum daqingense]
MARVSYVRADELESEYEDLVVSSLQPGKAVNVYSAVATNPPVLKGLRQFLGSLWSHSGLSDRQRELVILTAAHEIGVGYEWHQHVNIARNADITDAEIAALARDDREPFAEDEKAIIAYARAVVRGRVTDSLHDAVVEYVGEEATVGAATVAAGYLGLGRVIDALDVDLEDGDDFVGWDPR